MKRMSDKAKARYAEAKPVRDSLRESVGRCEVCGNMPYFGNVAALDVHEISRGVHRQKSLDKLFALLVCADCATTSSGMLGSGRKLDNWHCLLRNDYLTGICVHTWN